MRLCADINRSGRAAVEQMPLSCPPGELPGGIKIFHNSDAINIDYTMFLVSNSPIDDKFRLISPEVYYDESADLHVFALLCSPDSQHGANCYAVHFVGRLLGLSDEFDVAGGAGTAKKRTAFLDIMFRPGQAGSYLPSNDRQLYNVAVGDASALPQAIMFRPSFDKFTPSPGMESLPVKWYAQSSGVWIYQVGGDDVPSERERLVPSWTVDFGVMGMSTVSAIPRFDDFISLWFGVSTETKGSATVKVRCFDLIGCSPAGSSPAHLYWLCMRKLENSVHVQLEAVAMDDILTPLMKVPDYILLLRPDVATVDTTPDSPSA